VGDDAAPDDDPAASDPAGGDDVRAPTWWLVTLWVVVAVGVAVRFASRSHLWLDEALAVNIAKLPLKRLPDALRQDGAPPLYYVLLHGWIELFGTGTIAVRALSGIFGVAALPLAWVAGRRSGGRRVATAALVLLAASPFAVRYATEARMYSLLVVLTLVGWLALSDLLERFSWSSAITLAVATGLLLLTHYWSFYLVAVAVAGLGKRALKGPGLPEARRALLAVMAGGLLFVPWLPEFAYQMAHTGTPWGGPATAQALFDTVFEFAGGFWDPAIVLGLVLYVLIAFALLGRAVDRRRIELDLHLRPDARVLALAGFGTLAVAIVAGLVTRSAFAVRYASVLFVFVVLLAALGTRVLLDPRLYRGVVVLAAVLGLAATFPNVVGDRTSAARVARIIRAQARPGDVVAYCPDQLGPSVSRLLPADGGLVQLTYPNAGSPDRIDWVGYSARNHASRTEPFAQMLLARAGPTHTIWLVWAPGYHTFGGKCPTLVTRLERARADTQRVLNVSTKYFERPGLVRSRPG
jgi:hypothetical protein